MKPILSIWIRPRKTFIALEEKGIEEHDFNVTLLFFLISMTAGFSNASDFNRIFETNYYVILVVAMIISGLIGLFLWNTIFSWIIYVSSKLFQGKASKEEIKTVLAYSLIPNLIYLVIGLALIIPSTIIDNKDLIFFQHPILKFAIWILSFRTLLFGLAYFNKYSYGYALLTVLIPAAIMEGIAFGIKYLIN